MERALGPDHPDVAAVYHNLGGLEHARGRYARGEPHARRAVAIREQALGPDHPDVAADVAALAAILDGQGKYDEAEPLYRRAWPSSSASTVRSTTRSPSPEQPGGALARKGDEMKAERLYRRALAIKEKALGPDHPDTALTLNNLAVLCKSRGSMRRQSRCTSGPWPSSRRRLGRPTQR